MRRFFVIAAALLLTANVVGAQGVQFFDGTFEQALKAASEQNKKVFVDFYATWCGPCKMMEQNTFPEQRVGEYFNAKFINCRINAEDKAVSAVANKYRVKAFPTLMIVDAEGTVVRSQEGGMSADQLLKWAKTAMGDMMTYEQMFEKLKTDKNDNDLIRELLIGAPDFMQTQQGQQRDRWKLRIDRMYSDYRKQKKVAELMNPADFAVLMMYHIDPVKNDEVVEYIMSNYDAVTAAVGADKVNQYVFSLNTFLIQDLAQRGDMEYEKYLERIRGDMKPVYDALLKTGDIEPYTIMKYMNDGVYHIYKRRDVAKYISLMDEYFSTLGKGVVAGDYASATQTMYDALDGKLPQPALVKSVEWISKALQFEDLDTGERMDLLIMIGDCYKFLKDTENAKKCYKQAYTLSLQFGNPGLSAQVQALIDQL